MIARVHVDSPLPHLDRPFDYAIPDDATHVSVGTRVRVPFAGRLVSGVVVECVEESAHAGVKPLRSAAIQPSFTAASIALAASVAERYGGSLWDVLRLAPARVASVERLDWDAMAERDRPGRHAWAQVLRDASVVDAGVDPGFMVDARQGERRIVWCAAPNALSSVPAERLLAWAAGYADVGTGVVVLPDARALAAVVAAAVRAGLRQWTAQHGGDFAVIDADAPQARRYASHLAAQRGHVGLVIGTRQAAWLGVERLDAIAVWDESAWGHAEPRAPYPHVRTVAAMRAQEGAAMLIGGFTLGADAIALARHGFAELRHERPARTQLPFVELITEDRRQADGGRGRHWMPPAVWGPFQAAAKRSVAAVLAPQVGIGAASACVACGELALCRSCEMELQSAGDGTPSRCRSCGDAQLSWHCPHCRGSKVRPVGLGVELIAAQLRRMAPEVEVHVSSAAAGVLADGAVGKGIVVATPAALPSVEGGYAHLAIVGAQVDWSAGLGAEAAAVRRWLNAIALVAPRASGGAVSIIGEVGEAERSDLVALDGVAPGERDYEQRAQAGLPPMRRAVAVAGDAQAIEAATAALAGHPVEVTGSGSERMILASRGAMPAVVRAVRAVVVERSAAGASPLHLRVDAQLG